MTKTSWGLLIFAERHEEEQLCDLFYPKVSGDIFTEVLSKKFGRYKFHFIHSEVTFFLSLSFFCSIDCTVLRSEFCCLHGLL